MVIINAKKNQYETVRSFYHSLIDAVNESGVRYVGWEKDIYPSPEFLKKSIDNGEMYIALENDRIAAAMAVNHEYNEGYSEFRWPTEADDSEIMVIHALGVHPKYSRRGYAKTMVKKAVELAKDHKAKVIRLDVLAGNIPAKKLYTGMGFEYAATVQMYYEDTGWSDFLLYEYVVGK